MCSVCVGLDVGTSSLCRVLSFREWVLTDTADCTQLATRQRLRAKLEKILATRTAVAAGEGRREESDRRVREAESRARQAESRKREVEREKEVSEQRAATRIREAESKVKDDSMYLYNIAICRPGQGGWKRGREKDRERERSL